MRCTCGFDSPPGSIFCCGCGASLQQAPPSRAAERKALEVSGSALASLWLAVLAVPGVAADIGYAFAHTIYRPIFDACIFSLPLAFIAIALGFMASSRIRHSGGLVSGTWFARCGILLGSAVMLAICVGIILPQYIFRDRNERIDRAAQMIFSVKFAAEEYQRAFPNRGYPRDLADLPQLYERSGNSASLWTRTFQHQIAAVRSSGYSFVYTPQISGPDGRVTGFKVTADPPADSKWPHFYLDNGDGLHYERGRPATSASPEWR